MSETHLISDDELPRGFRFAAVKAGIKPSGKADFAVAVADRIASAAAMFTANRVQAAPIAVGRRHLERSGGLLRVVAVNAGNANCATGSAGIEGSRASVQLRPQRPLAAMGMKSFLPRRELSACRCRRKSWWRRCRR